MIPKIIHQIWIGPKKRPDIYMKTWYDDYVKMYPEYTYMLWDDDKINEILKYNEIIGKLYDMETTMYGKADIARYMIMYYYGGIYIDADSVWLNNKNLDCLINGSNDFFIANVPDKDRFANGVFGCTKNNTKMEILISKLESMIDSYQSIRIKSSPWKVTGPMLISMFNLHNPTFKYIVAHYEVNPNRQTIKSIINSENKIKTYWFSTFDEAKENFDNFTIKNNMEQSIVLFDVVNNGTLHKRGYIIHINECVNYIRNAFIINKVTIFPSHYFYPISWIGINDPQLHEKIDIDPECFMFQYGISTNKLQY